MAGRAQFEYRVSVLAGVTVVNKAVDRVVSTLEGQGWTVESYGVGETTASGWSLGGLLRQWYPVRFRISKINGTSAGAKTALIYAMGKEALSYEGLAESRREFVNEVLVPTVKDIGDPRNWWEKIPTWVKVVVGGGVALYALGQVATISRAFRR